MSLLPSVRGVGKVSGVDGHLEASSYSVVGPVVRDQVLALLSGFTVIQSVLMDTSLVLVVLQDHFWVILNNIREGLSVNQSESGFSLVSLSLLLEHA